MSDWNANVIEEFRANDGKVGGFFEDKPVLILHATGRSIGSGARHSARVPAKRETALFIFASKGGSHSHPDWYHNLKANPAVSVEIGAGTVIGNSCRDRRRRTRRHLCKAGRRHGELRRRTRLPRIGPSRSSSWFSTSPETAAHIERADSQARGRIDDEPPLPALTSSSGRSRSLRRRPVQSASGSRITTAVSPDRRAEIGVEVLVDLAPSIPESGALLPLGSPALHPARDRR